MKDQTTKRRWPRAEAIPVARELCELLKPVTIRLVVAGSLRRDKPDVGDVEILYVGRTEERQIDLFNVEPVCQAAEQIERLVAAGVLAKRISLKGSASWGPKNKLAVHVASGVPVDLFAATEENWCNYLVCRTGPAESNKRIASAAIARGWKWHPYGAGFSRAPGDSRKVVAMSSEAEVFEFVGLPYRPPHARD